MDTPPFEEFEKDLVRRSLKRIEEVTCVKFVQRTNEDYYINLTVCCLLREKINVIFVIQCTFRVPKSNLLICGFSQLHYEKILFDTRCEGFVLLADVFSTSFNSV